MTTSTSFSDRLRDKAVIVEGSVGKWGATTTDRKATDIVSATTHAASDSGRFIKHLIKRHEFAGIERTERMFRDFIRRATIAWGENSRVLPAELLLQFMQQVRELQKQFYDNVNAFLNRYEELKEQERQRLGDLYNEEDYPTKEELREKFYMRVDFLPLPDVDNFVIRAADEAIVAVKQNVEENYKQLATHGRDLLLNRLRQKLEKVVNAKRFDKRTLGNAIQEAIVVAAFDKIFDLGQLGEGLKSFVHFNGTPEEARAVAEALLEQIADLQREDSQDEAA